MINPKNEDKTWVYHQLQKPEGKIVSFSDANKLYKHGWVDTPAKYGKGLKGKWYSLIIKSKKLTSSVFSFTQNEYQWIITTVIALIALYLTWTALR